MKAPSEEMYSKSHSTQQIYGYLCR